MSILVTSINTSIIRALFLLYINYDVFTDTPYPAFACTNCKPNVCQMRYSATNLHEVNLIGRGYLTLRSLVVRTTQW